ncbi:MAG: hypothetical protein M3161_02970 [Actinomycetota bacterium]|nr:hypothetical protein [Actinomycetota bacterium]
MPVDRVEECSLEDEFTSLRLGMAGVTDDGSQLKLDVLVLLDGVSRPDAEEALSSVDVIYEPLKIDVALRYRRLPPVPGSRIRDVDLIQISKDAVGGQRPKGVDVVYTLTSREIFGGFGDSTAGRADCIGGIKYPHRAFAVGEHGPPSEEAPPFTYREAYSAKIAAHEIGHLLGAAHEYSNCAEGSDTDPTRDIFGICTVMFNDVSLIGMKFSTLEGSVIRGYASDYVVP